LALRQFRKANPWLHGNLDGLDRFNRISTDNAILFYGLRSAPKDASTLTAKKVAAIAHMGGEPITVTLGDLLQIDLAEWKVAIASPGLELDETGASLRSFEIKDSQAILLQRI